MVDSKKKGGSMLSDLGALTVPFGLIAARNTLETFIKNRERELKKFQNERLANAKTKKVKAASSTKASKPQAPKSKSKQQTKASTKKTTPTKKKSDAKK